jgi:hypothetical protein
MKIELGIARIGAVVTVALALLWPAPVVAASSVPLTSSIMIGGGCLNCGYDAARLQAKENRQLAYDALSGRIVISAAVVMPMANPTSKVLSISASQYIVEPEGTLDRDAHAIAYTDLNYWKFCAPGAAAIVMSYVTQGLVPISPYSMTGSFTEPANPYHQSTTYWVGGAYDYRGGYWTTARGYIMYMAEAVLPTPSANYGGVPGIDYFGGGYPTTGTTLATVVDALNWETAGHNAYWPGYFWAGVRNTGSGWSQAILHNDVVTDINWVSLGDNGLPVWAAVDAYYMRQSAGGYGNFGSGTALGTTHAIAIVGYDDTVVAPDGYTGIYYYLDSCGARCSAGTNGGIHMVSQHQMYVAMNAVTLNGVKVGGFIW